MYIIRRSIMSKTIDYQKIENRARSGRIVLSIVIYTLLILWGLIVLFPFYWTWG